MGGGGGAAQPPSLNRVKGGNYKILCKRSMKKLVVIAMMPVPGPFNRYHEVKHNSAITPQNQLEFWKQRQNRVSRSSFKILVLKPIFSVPDPLL